MFCISRLILPTAIISIHFRNGAAYMEAKCFSQTFEDMVSKECSFSDVSESKIALYLYPIETFNLDVVAMINYAFFDCCALDPTKFISMDQLTVDIQKKNKKINGLRCACCHFPKGRLLNYMAMSGVTNNDMIHIHFFNTLGNNNTLSDQLLKNLFDLKILDLTNNNINHIHGDAFKDLNSLIKMYLKYNKIESLKSKTFASLSNLKTLDLSNNKLTELPEGLFKSMTKLDHLYLESNRIKFIHENLFSDLISLSVLILSNNNLTIIPTKTFNKTKKLNVLHINNNQINSLSSSIIAVKGMRRNLTGEFFTNLYDLTGLEIMNNKIESLSEYLFWNCKKLKSISLSGNSITLIQKDLFMVQINLEELDLENNKISYIDENAFRNLINLDLLNLNRNSLSSIPKNLFKNLKSLSELQMSYNYIKEISLTSLGVSGRLTFIDMSHNELISVSEENRTLESQKGFIVYDIDLSHNKLTKIPHDIRTQAHDIGTLNMSNNRISHLQFKDMKFKTESIEIDVSMNNISNINLADIYNNDTLDAPVMKEVSLHLKMNPIQCDCLLSNLIQYIQKKGRVKNKAQIIFMDTQITMCDVPTRMKNTPINRVKLDDLQCEIDDTIHGPCKYFYRLYDNVKTLVVNCSKIKVDNNKRPYTYGTLKYNEVEMYYEWNNLTSLAPKLYGDDEDSMSHFHRITKLFVQGNNISVLSSKDIPKNIRVLNLRNNKLKLINYDVINELKELEQLWISGNPFQCSCDNLIFFGYLQAKNIIVKDYHQITCSNGQKVSEIDLSELCEVFGIISTSAAVAAIGLFLGTLTGLYYKYRLEIKVWLYSKDIWWGNDPDDDKLYDAFISYSHKDEEFITKIIVPRLEDSDNYKLCLHYRNWVPGEFISTQIASSVEQSRRTLVILSPYFLESVWGRMEFRTAHQQALKEGRARVVVVLYGDIGPTDNLDPELKAYLSMNTYVKWGDPWFWDKLRYALPHKKRSKVHNSPCALFKKNGSNEKSVVDLVL